MVELDYDSLMGVYDRVLERAIPRLTKDTVDTLVDATNTLVRSDRPRQWAIQIPELPQTIIGITSDHEKVVYRENGRFGSYRAKPFDEIHQVVSDLVGKTRREYEEGTNPDSSKIDDKRYKKIAKQDLENAQQLLGTLVSLK